MISIKKPSEIEVLREGGKRLARILRLVGEKAAPGVTTKELDDYARTLTEEGGDQSAFLNYAPDENTRAYPASLCVSINDEIVHGIPNEGNKVLKEGDIVGLDMGLVHGGLFVDAAITVGVGDIDNRAKRLLKANEEALYKAIDAAVVGANVNKIADVVEEVAARERFSIAEDLGGHGVGYAVHEDPFIPNYRIGGKQPRLQEGMVIAIEPMFCEGKPQIKVASDGWTIKTCDGKRAAHFEHTIVVTKDGPEILTKE